MRITGFRKVHLPGEPANSQCVAKNGLSSQSQVKPPALIQLLAKNVYGTMSFAECLGDNSYKLSEKKVASQRDNILLSIPIWRHRSGDASWGNLLWESRLRKIQYRGEAPIVQKKVRRATNLQGDQLPPSPADI